MITSIQPTFKLHAARGWASFAGHRLKFQQLLQTNRFKNGRCRRKKAAFPSDDMPFNALE
jgi:hypothetical protein